MQSLTVSLFWATTAAAAAALAFGAGVALATKVGYWIEDWSDSVALALITTTVLLFATIFATILVAVLIIGGHRAI